MNKLALDPRFSLWVILTCATSGELGAQGTLQFNNRVFGVVVAPIFGLEPGSILVNTGNPQEGEPACEQVYHGPKLQGAGYTVELWGGPEGTPANLLSPVARTIFRTGAVSGYVQTPATPVVVPSVPPGQRATLQLRAW